MYHMLRCPSIFKRHESMAILTLTLDYTLDLNSNKGSPLMAWMNCLPGVGISSTKNLELFTCLNLIHLPIENWFDSGSLDEY
jgi:hypothetical protein